MLTASQLGRALRAFRRLAAEEASETHALEYVDYHWAEDGSLYLRARLPAEDGVLVVRALEAAQDAVRARRRAEAAMRPSRPPRRRRRGTSNRPRSVHVEALVDVALSSTEGAARRRHRVLVSPCMSTR